MNYGYVMIVALLVAALGACGDEQRTKTPVEPGFPLVDAVAGTCGHLAPNGRMNRFIAVSCTGEHESEVAGTYDLTGEEYPGQSALRLETQLACQPIFDRYVGVSYWTSRYELRAIPPAPSAWAMGERKVICLVVDKDGKMLEARRAAPRGSSAAGVGAGAGVGFKPAWRAPARSTRSSSRGRLAMPRAAPTANARAPW